MNEPAPIQTVNQDPKLTQEIKGTWTGTQPSVTSVPKKNVIINLDSKIDPKLLFEEVKDFEYKKEGDYIEMAFEQSGGVPSGLFNHPTLKKALDEIAFLRKLEIVNVMLNRMPPGAKIPEHRDFIVPTKLQPQRHPCVERWHLPIVTNSLVKYSDAVNGEFHFVIGKWTGPIPYWIEHRVVNLGTVERVHLIVDLDTPEPVGKYEH